MKKKKIEKRVKEINWYEAQGYVISSSPYDAYIMIDFASPQGIIYHFKVKEELVNRLIKKHRTRNKVK